MTGGAFAFCRDCLTPAGAAPRCRACGSPRLARHPELARMTIAHVDCDAFFAAVEKRDDPSLVDRPVIIGGGKRGVVSTACYVARISGVKSAMPMFKALKLCPDAVVIRPNMAKYVEVGRAVRAKMLALTPLVEPLSIDEAFLDLSGTEALHKAPPAVALAGFAREVERDLGISVSVGLASNKFLAKIASDLDKPRGFAVLSADEAPAFLAPRPVGFLWGVGPAFAETLTRDGYRTIGDLQRAEASTLARAYGESGLRLAQLAFGRDNRRVNPDRERKSVGAETTFDADIRDPDELARHLWRMSEKVADRLRAGGIAGRTVTLKLKTADFRLRTRAGALPAPTRLAQRIFETAQRLMRKEAAGEAFRLIGVSVSDLAPAAAADPRDLVDDRSEKLGAIETAVADLRARFGRDAVERAFALRPERTSRPEAGNVRDRRTKP
ncbi:DNA polymerase IV [Methylopila jiangsuensis]|uniref:DNA polymerase IV n=1 Tax=Methylopila jiangsuensis TaxID=586230 RepID=A0A9W6JDD2_9HYPH|nr:DNA polymerase IV [Methylopila jiangsuensis]MDR6285738.1 DNA polymerase-4 [Methylopila jiangsuensis]GLK75495.1 DNA polymerase IV [Methylopila jiangsuensis]